MFNQPTVKQVQLKMHKINFKFMAYNILPVTHFLRKGEYVDEMVILYPSKKYINHNKAVQEW